MFKFFLSYDIKITLKLHFWHENVYYFVIMYAMLL